MEKVLIKMLGLGMDISFKTAIKNLDNGMEIRFVWEVSQDYCNYDNECEWEGFGSEKECFDDFKNKSTEIVKEVRKLLRAKNKE